MKFHAIQGFPCPVQCCGDYNIYPYNNDQMCRFFTTGQWQLDTCLNWRLPVVPRNISSDKLHYITCKADRYQHTYVYYYYCILPCILQFSPHFSLFILGVHGILVVVVVVYWHNMYIYHTWVRKFNILYNNTVYQEV